MTKTIIFVGGTARSGSTLLELILANDSRAMALGEIHVLFCPTRKHHFEELEKLKNDPVWSKIISDGKKLLYSNLIKHFPGTDIFIDSSKDPFWFRYHRKNSPNDCLIKNVLIYKTPQEIAKSFIKRGKTYKWIQVYENYHKKYFSLIDDFVTISYKDLVQSDETLKTLCFRIGVYYFKEKKNYWQSNQTPFFGSSSVYHPKTNDQDVGDKPRHDLTYDKPDEDTLRFVSNALKNNKTIALIHETLNKNSVMRNTPLKIPSQAKYSYVYLQLTSFKNKLIRKYKYFFPDDYFGEHK